MALQGSRERPDIRRAAQVLKGKTGKKKELEKEMKVRGWLEYALSGKISLAIRYQLCTGTFPEQTTL